MPSWLVFCTTQVPTKVIEKFQDQSTLSWLAPDDPWILQKTPEGGIHGPYLACPVASFTTGFENASPEYLQSFTEESIKDKTEFPGLNFNDICSDTFVILDKRSLEDGTCEVYHRFQKSAPGFEFAVRTKETPLVDEWKSWRVRFVTSWFMCNGLWFNDGFIEELMPKYGGLYIDDKGVLQMAYIEQDTYQLEDWEDRAPWGPGGPPPQS